MTPTGADILRGAEINTRDIMCCQCGKGAAYNTPYVKVLPDPALEPLDHGLIWCERCAKGDRSGALFVGVAQHLDKFTGEPQFQSWHDYQHWVKWNESKTYIVTRQSYMISGCVVNQTMKYDERSNRPTQIYNEHAWTEGGSTAYELTNHEKLMDPADLAREMRDMVNAEYFRCTGCGDEYPVEKIAGRPLFAGVNCKHCWQKHLDETEQQRKTGKVCGMCRQPYNNCCC